jgi:hypothetical protein
MLKKLVARRVVWLVCGIAVLATAAPAVAQSPTQGGYSPGGPPVVVPKEPREPQNRAVTARPRRLAFTGLDVRLIVLGGLCLLGAGYALRRVSSPLNE